MSLRALGDIQAMRDGILVKFPADFNGVGHGNSDMDGKCCSRDLLHLGYLGHLGFFGMVLLFTGYSEQTHFSMIKMIPLSYNPEIGIIILRLGSVRES